VIDGHLRGTPNFDLVPLVSTGEPFLSWLRSCLSRTRTQRPDAAAARAKLREITQASQETEYRVWASYTPVVSEQPAFPRP
jgi:hypothetical protein